MTEKRGATPQKYYYKIDTYNNKAIITRLHRRSD